jgi:sigma-54 specific flagellar transcriptional regulator A
VPTLSERSSDIPLLINNQLDRIRKRIPHQAQFSEGAINILMQYDWPGNIRELANFIERMVVLYQDKVIEDNDVSEQLNRVKSKQHQFILPDDIDNFNMKAYLSTIEQQIINIALEKSNGIVSSAAEYLNLGRTTLIEKMKKYKLVTNE